MKNEYFDETGCEAGFAGFGEPLNAQEEISLSKRILAGKAAEETLSKAECPADEDRAALLHTVEDGKQAYDRLVLANYPRAMKFAHSTFRRNPFGLDTCEDYVQTALRVICEAAHTFDWRRGCRFSTWVHQQLKQEMIRENALMSYAIRIPEDNLCRISSLKHNAEEQGIGAAAKALGMTRSNAEKLLQAGNVSKSLQDPINGEDPDTELGDILADATAITAEEIEEKIDAEADLKKIWSVYPRIPQKEQMVIWGRMGFGSGTPVRLKDLVGVCAESLSGVQKRELAAKKHLRELADRLPLAG